jgi:hypothetical protein
VPKHVLPLSRQSVNGALEPTVHHVTVVGAPVVFVGQYEPSAIVIDDVGVVSAGGDGGGVFVTELAQWISRRNVSSARRASCCARTRFDISASAFDPETKSCVSAVTTTRRIARTTIISLSE